MHCSYLFYMWNMNQVGGLYNTAHLVVYRCYQYVQHKLSNTSLHSTCSLVHRGGGESGIFYHVRDVKGRHDLITREWTKLGTHAHSRTCDPDCQVNC